MNISRILILLFISVATLLVFVVPTVENVPLPDPRALVETAVAAATTVAIPLIQLGISAGKNLIGRIKNSFKRRKANKLIKKAENLEQKDPKSQEAVNLRKEADQILANLEERKSLAPALKEVASSAVDIAEKNPHLAPVAGQLRSEIEKIGTNVQAPTTAAIQGRSDVKAAPLNHQVQQQIQQPAQSTQHQVIPQVNPLQGQTSVKSPPGVNPQPQVQQQPAQVQPQPLTPNVQQPAPLPQPPFAQVAPQAIPAQAQQQ